MPLKSLTLKIHGNDAGAMYVGFFGERKKESKIEIGKESKRVRERDKERLRVWEREKEKKIKETRKNSIEINIITI